jgi:hypothetical protein
VSRIPCPVCNHKVKPAKLSSHISDHKPKPDNDEGHYYSLGPNWAENWDSMTPTERAIIALVIRETA